jgi:hypothetical protein
MLAGSIANAKLANSSITINGAATALGGSVSAGSITWQSVIVSDGSTVTTMVAGRGYFVNNTSAAGIVKLPAGGTAGDTIAIKDYAGNFGTNALTIQRNGHNIQGVTNDGRIATNRASVTLVYIDATKGWLYTNESNVAELENKGYTTATGGTVTTSGDFKIHSFTGDGNFVVSSAGFGPTATSSLDYLVIAGGGGGGGGEAGNGAGGGGGAGGAGGYRYSAVTYCAPSNPLGAGSAITAAQQTYPITVGGGGGGAAGHPSTAGSGNRGSNSVFSTITSTGGGGGSGCQGSPYTNSNGPGGSGGGNSGDAVGGAGTGNTPPVSPSQGNTGGANQPNRMGGGGGGAGQGGQTPGSPGGDGDTNSITGSGVTRAGGGGGGGGNGPRGGGGGQAGGGAGGSAAGAGSSSCAGGQGSASSNSGSGGGGKGAGGTGSGGSGGSGVVIIRYRYQN